MQQQSSVLLRLPCIVCSDNKQTATAACNGDRKRILTGKEPLFEAAFIKWIDNVCPCSAPQSRPLVSKSCIVV